MTEGAAGRAVEQQREPGGRHEKSTGKAYSDSVRSHDVAVKVSVGNGRGETVGEWWRGGAVTSVAAGPGEGVGADRSR